MELIVGANRRYYTCEDGTAVTIKAVLVQREDGKFTGFIAGYGSNRYVADYGNKMSFNEAKSHFPHIEEREYTVL